MFSSAKQKIERANYHISELERQFAAIIGTEAFAGGRGDDLYQLHQLDNADKHTVITPIIRATSHPPLKVMLPGGGIISMENNVMIGG